MLGYEAVSGESWFSASIHSGYQSYTGCTQSVLLCPLRAIGTWVQSQSSNITFNLQWLR
jgi:hypothetical protein